MTRWAFGAALVLAPALAGCELLFPTVEEQPGADGGPDGGRVAYDDPDSSDWQIHSFGYAFTPYQGGAFDGRNVYFSPLGGPVARYDTHLSFAKGWSSFNTATLGDAGNDNFSGAAFDGRFVYFMAYAAYGTDSIFARYDTSRAFDAPSSWTQFDVTSAYSEASSFEGAAFDGRFLYFAPKVNAYVVRYDTSLPFDRAASWGGFDAGAIGGAGFEGAIFDGRYVYLVPNYRFAPAALEGTATGMAVRYDTHGTFGSVAAWSLFDTSTLSRAATGFAGGAFDGRYVYFVPNHGTVALRYDTQQTAFEAKSSWDAFECDATGFVGAAFDGRYVYFVPSVNATGGYSSVLLRYDTSRSFRDSGSWISYDISNQNSNALGFAGAVFDGESIYFVPYDIGLALRFRARTTPLLPHLPTFPGSFL